MKQERVPDVNGKRVINAFQWAKARLTLEHPSAMGDIQRLEADSKFFRSLVVVLLFGAAWPFICRGASGWLSTPCANPPWLFVPFGLLLAPLSFWRYAERRFKSTQQAYWYVIILDRYVLPAKKSDSAPSTS